MAYNIDLIKQTNNQAINQCWTYKYDRCVTILQKIVDYGNFFLIFFLMFYL